MFGQFLSICIIRSFVCYINVVNKSFLQRGVCSKCIGKPDFESQSLKVVRIVVQTLCTQLIVSR